MAAGLFTPRGIRPTAEQTAIAQAPERLAVVEANAGAAKTTTLALCLAQALRRGALPQQLLALTYTAPAIDALRDAILRIGVPAPVARRIRVSSFDEFSRTQLQSKLRRARGRYSTSIPAAAIGSIQEGSSGGWESTRVTRQPCRVT